jgi:acyl carrier protein
MSEPDSKVLQILWQSIEGGSYDLDELKRKVNSETKLTDILDSLDIADFLLRLEHQYKISVPHEEYSNLNSIGAIEAYMRDRSPALARA